LAFTGYEQNETMGITDTAILTSELIKLLHIDGEKEGKATYSTKGGFVQISYDIDMISQQVSVEDSLKMPIITYRDPKMYSKEWVNGLKSMETRSPLLVWKPIKIGSYSNKVYLKTENGEPIVSDDSESDFRNITDDRYKSLFLAFPQLQGEVKVSEKQHNVKYPHVSDALSMLNNQPDNRFGAFADWLRGLNRVANDKQVKEGKIPKERVLLNKVFEVISDITDETISLHKIVVKESGKDTIWVKMGNESSPILFELVSQGYNNVFGWVGYFMKRLVEVTTGDEDFTQTPAIVLIDEIDTYLHPKWQTKILAVLVATFPNVQFIVTTHSPYVVGSVPNDKIKIYICQKQDNTIKIEEFEEFTPYGANIERLSDKIFGVKGRFVKEVREKLEHLSEVINTGDLTSAKTYLADNFSDIDSNDPDLKRSKMLIRTKEILAK
jgi:AAA domain, putative AbiEii toxin, Type IV TA system